MSTDIERSLQNLRDRIAQVAKRAGRDPSDIRLVAITKARSVAEVRRAYEAGQRDFGENRVEEALPKQQELADLTDIRWHMVGHIQSRKAQQVAPYFDLVHSVDRLKIAHRLDRFAEQVQRPLAVLLECNVSGEPTKFGWALEDRSAWSDGVAAFRSLLELEHLDIRGLMTMAPMGSSEGALRGVFSRLRELLDFCNAELGVRWAELSMGMTDDYEVAIEEGATLLRIGRAIFGERP